MARRFVERDPAQDAAALQDVLRDVLRDAMDVLDAEVRIAGLEARETARAASRQAWLFAGAGTAGFALSMTLTAVCVVVLAIAMPVWLAALFTGILVGGNAFAAFILGRANLEDVELWPHRTSQSLKHDAALVAFPPQVTFPAPESTRE